MSIYQYIAQNPAQKFKVFGIYSFIAEQLLTIRLRVTFINAMEKF